MMHVPNGPTVIAMEEAEILQGGLHEKGLFRPDTIVRLFLLSRIFLLKIFKDVVVQIFKAFSENMSVQSQS